MGRLVYEEQGEKQVLREDFPEPMQRDLERLENEAGIQFDESTFCNGVYSNGPYYSALGITMDRYALSYERRASGKRSILAYGKDYSFSKYFPFLKKMFDDRIDFVRHSGDEVGKLGVDTEGLDAKSKLNLDTIILNMGIDLPWTESPKKEKLTQEEIANLAEVWKTYWKEDL